MTTEAVREEFTHLLGVHVAGLKIKGTKATGSVPWREDQHPSFSADIEQAVWYDHARQEGGGVREFKERLGLREVDLTERKIVATYDYKNESGTLLFQVVRFDPKGFTQRRPNGKGGWLWNLHETRRVLYRLPEILAADIVYIVEGEKDADKLWEFGIPATTNSSGAGKWLDTYSETLTGKHVAIIPDNDEAGEHHAQQVARALLPVALGVKIVSLPGLSKKGDVSDWLDAGHSKEELTALVKATEVLKPKDLTTKQEPKSNSLLLTRLGDLLSEPEEQVSWLVDKMLPSAGFSVLVAKPKAGKSTLARNLALVSKH